MVKAFISGALVFGAIYTLLRLSELAYHRLRKTPDWSPHWGSWVFAILLAAYAALNEAGK